MCTGEHYSGSSLKWGEFSSRNHGGEYDATPFKRNSVYYIDKQPFLTHRQTGPNFPHFKQANSPPFKISCMGMVFLSLPFFKLQIG